MNVDNPSLKLFSQVILGCVKLIKVHIIVRLHYVLETDVKHSCTYYVSMDKYVLSYYLMLNTAHFV